MKMFRVGLGGVEENQAAIEAAYPGDSLKVYGDSTDPKYWLVRDLDDNDLGTLPKRGALIDALLAGAEIASADVQCLTHPTDEKPFYSISVNVEVRMPEEDAFLIAGLAVLRSAADTAPTPKSYKVGIVGESNYQAAIRACAVYEPVRILRERGNPYDADAVVVVKSARGDTIGYVARSSWLRDALVNEGKGCTATIASVERGDGEHLGIVLDLVLTRTPLDECDYVAAPKSVDAEPTSPPAPIKSEMLPPPREEVMPKRWWSRLL